MSIDPKAAVLARQLGQLMRAYAPNATEGHALLELAQWFQAGLADPREGNSVRLQLPVTPAIADESVSKDPALNLDGEYLLQVDVRRCAVDIEAVSQHSVRELSTPVFQHGPSATVKIERATREAPAGIVIHGWSSSGEHQGHVIVR